MDGAFFCLGRKTRVEGGGELSAGSTGAVVLTAGGGGLGASTLCWLLGWGDAGAITLGSSTGTGETGAITLGSSTGTGETGAITLGSSAGIGATVGRLLGSGSGLVVALSRILPTSTNAFMVSDPKLSDGIGCFSFSFNISNKSFAVCCR